MQERRCFLCIAGICYVALLTISVSSQELSTARFVTFKELLQERKIELTEDSLVSALRNPDSHTRYLAALVLAEDKVKDAVPAITEALEKEDNPETHVNMALALAQLGSDRGTDALKGACTDAHMSPMFRVYAVKYLLDLGKESASTQP
jgi:HEAT repeat protein